MFWEGASYLGFKKNCSPEIIPTAALRLNCWSIKKFYFPQSEKILPRKSIIWNLSSTVDVQCFKILWWLFFHHVICLFALRYHWQHSPGAEAGCCSNWRWHKWWPRPQEGGCWLCYGTAFYFLNKMLLWTLLECIYETLPQCARPNTRLHAMIPRVSQEQMLQRRHLTSSWQTTISLALSRLLCGAGTCMTAFPSFFNSNLLSTLLLSLWPSPEPALPRSDLYNIFIHTYKYRLLGWLTNMTNSTAQT